MMMLDLFCGRWGWSKAFVERGWECVGVDLVEPPEIPEGCRFIKRNILDLLSISPDEFDFICASSPCEQFSVHGMKHFHPDPPYPELGIRLFEHTKAICEASGIPYVMENVRAAQQFVGRAVHHCGPFYLWGTGVPPLMPQGVKKGFNRDWDPVTRKRSPMQLAQVSNKVVYSGMEMGNSKAIKQMTPEQKRAYRKQFSMISAGSKSTERQLHTAQAATIPPELAGAVADYATRLYEARVA